MIRWKTPQFYERHIDVAEKQIAIALGAGQITLALGAGVSKTIGVPTWPDLAEQVCQALAKISPAVAAVTTDSIDGSWDTDSILLRMQHVRDKLHDDAVYCEAITACLYRPWGGNVPPNPSRMLQVIGSLIRPSRAGSVRMVVTLNFDCLLEWHLQSRGLVLQVIEDFPKQLVNCDAHVFHPHGYLPASAVYGVRSNEVIFDQRAVIDRILDRPGGWNDAFRYLAGSSTFLAVGLSGRDPLHRLILAASKRQRRSSETMGFWYMRTSKDARSDDLMSDLRASGIAVLELPEYTDIEESLARIRGYAGGSILP